MLNILFWNLHKNSLENYIANCLAENDIDIAAFSEFSGINFINLEKQLGTMYNRIRLQKDGKVTLLAKTTFSVESVQEQNRYNIYNVKTAVKDYLLVTVHLEDRRNFNRDDRMNTIRGVISTIEETEELFKCNNTIVIGDFNANFCDKELLSKYAFNSVLFKSIIDKSELTNPYSLKQRRFYNPILHYISEDTGMYGSFYYDRDSMTPYWYCLDQVLVRKGLANSIERVEYLKKIETEDLLKNGIPNKSISDHLPLLVNLSEVKNEV